MRVAPTHLHLQRVLGDQQHPCRRALVPHGTHRQPAAVQQHRLLAVVHRDAKRNDGSSATGDMEAKAFAHLLLCCWASRVIDASLFSAGPPSTHPQMISGKYRTGWMAGGKGGIIGR